MLQFLRERTFKANEVFLNAIAILGKHYVSIAGLCFLLFVVSNLSTFLSFYFEGAPDFVRIFFMLFFVVMYFGLQLVLLKRAVHLTRDEAPIKFIHYIPSTKQFVSYITGLVVYSLMAATAYLIVYIICFPLLYLGVNMDTIRYEIHPLLTGVLMLVIVMRTVFYPFFIIEQNCGTWRAYKFSLALTKGNVFSLLFVVMAVASTHMLQLGAEYMGYGFIGKLFSIINAFVIIPLVSLVMSVVYVDMMKEYRGGEDPSLLDSII